MKTIHQPLKVHGKGGAEGNAIPQSLRSRLEAELPAVNNMAYMISLLFADPHTHQSLTSLPLKQATVSPEHTDVRNVHVTGTED